MASMTKHTEPVSWLNNEAIGYIVNTKFSPQNAQFLAALAQEISNGVHDALSSSVAEALHITLLDWIAPLYSYDDQDKDKLFERIRSQYDTALSQAVKAFGPITVHFDTIKVSPSTVIAIGRDEGQFQCIRDEFVRHVDVLTDTKPPPTIIHSSLGRFVKAVDVQHVEDVIADISLDLTQVVTEFRLMRSTDAIIGKAEILKLYPLAS
jgi:hypothetical protein